ncbi:hypothetical protein CRE_02725 [Caenorhabditis remanei]|uniref:DDE Tnp4 domain-containing protein n=1 Tax=Caenorhabditis remanei TaxID=31234 RepID=E3NPP8_CAERE|nr:hypothetical protein CRE_02725 [Caenorhabditis remanei]
MEKSNERKRKLAAAVALETVTRTCATLLHIRRQYDLPSDGVDVIAKEKFEHFLNIVKAAQRSHETEKYFGLNEENFTQILSMCRSRDRAMRIPPDARLMVFMKYIREGRSESYLAKDIGISQPTVSRIVLETIYDIAGKASEFIRFPTSYRDIRDAEQGFLSKTDKYGRSRNVPCFGCVDGKHWATEHPPNSGSVNANYKGFFSYNSLIVCDADLRIRYLQVSELGVSNDAQLYLHGKLPMLLEKAVGNAGYRLLDDEETVMPPFLLADNGFKLRKTCMQPYRQARLTVENMAFNRRISAVRVRVENVFGSMTSKFQVVDRKIKLSPANGRTLIAALCVVHNIQIGEVPTYQDVDDMVPVLSDPYKTAEEMREALKRYLLKN